MPGVDAATAQEYRLAWEEWVKQVEHVHRVLLEGETLTPDRFKGLLNREVRAKERYDEARLKLLGVEDTLAEPPADGSNPFR
ncbi:MAG: hypothetical protein WEC33_03390 [Dehalococcoidia bacterium]